MLSFTPQLALSIQAQTVLSKKSVGARKRGVRCLSHQANALVCSWPDAAEHANEVYNHSKRPVPGQHDVVEPIVLERRASSGQTECDLLPRESQVRGHPGVVWRLRSNRNIPQCAEEIWIPAPCSEFLSVGTGGSHGIKIVTFRDDGEVEEVFTSTIVRTRDTVFPLFGSAGTKPATEAELQEFGESVRARPDEFGGPSLALRRPDVEIKEADGNLALGEEMQDDRGREQPDPEELRRRAAEGSADAAEARPSMKGGAGSSNAEPRRRITVKRPASPVERREEQQSGGGDDREEPPTRRLRVARAVAQLRALVAMTSKTDSDQC